MQSQRYLDRDQFQKKLRRALRLNAYQSATVGLNTVLTQTHIDLCWHVYKNARNNDHGRLVCGLLDDLRDARRELGGTNDQHTGSVLNVVNRNKALGQSWTILVNDCWILGGIHGQLPFYLASDPSASATFQNPYYIHGHTPDAHRMRVTARELLGLVRFGYYRSNSPQLDSSLRMMGIRYELICINSAAANSATIASYLQYVQAQADVMNAHGAMPIKMGVRESLGI